MKHIALALLFLCPALAQGAERLAVLNIEGTEVSQALYYTDLLRGYASRHTQFMVLTRENIETLIEPSILERCVGQCEVTVGRLLGSHQVVSGVMFGKSKLILKLHNTKSGALIRSVAVSGEISARLESSFLELMGLKETSFQDLEARYLRAKREKELKAEMREREKREREARKRREEEEVKERERREERERSKEEIRRGLTWTINSPFRRRWGYYSYYTQEFKFVSKPLPSLWLEYEDPRRPFGDRKYYHKYHLTLSGRYLYSNGKGRATSFYIDQVSYVEKGIGYDNKGRKLIPLQLKEKEEKSFGGGLYPQNEDMWVYANQELLKEDLDAYYRAMETRFIGVLLSPLPVVGSLFIYFGTKRKNPSLLLKEQRAITVGLVTANILLYGLIGWLITDTNEYNYPHYIEGMGYSTGKRLMGSLRKAR